jgi:hypothetical protein
MAGRDSSSACLLALTLSLITSPGASQASPPDVWVGCVHIPVSWCQPPPVFPPPPRPVPAKPRLAQPTAAPPSSGPYVLGADTKPPKESQTQPGVAESANPAASSRMPGVAVREEGPFYDSYPIVLKPEQKPLDDQCTVSFKNLSGHPIKLTIDMQERTLTQDGSVTLPVKRQFVWRMEGREAQSEQIKPGNYALQIVIRR